MRMNLKQNDKFYWENCSKFERETIGDFSEPIRVFIGVYDAKVYTIDTLEEQLEGKDIEVHIPLADPIYHTQIITFECKNDTHINSPNFFFEDVSNDKTNTIGWTFKSKADYLAYGYYDINNKILKKVYFLDMKKLISWFDCNYHQFEPKIIKNNGYNTIGRAVPRDLMWDLGVMEFVAEKDLKIESEMFS